MGIISLGLACDALKENGFSEMEQDSILRDAFEKKLLSEIPELLIHSREETRICNTSSVLFSGAQADLMLMALDLRGYDISAGSACSSGSIKFSPVIKSMGYSEADAGATLRFSFGRGNQLEEIDDLVSALAGIYKLQRESF